MIQNEGLQTLQKKSDWQFANFAINIGPWKTSFIFCKKKNSEKQKQILQIIQNNNLLNLWRNHQWPPLSKVFPFSYSIRAAPQRKCPQAPLLYCVHDSPTTVFNLPIALQAASLIFISLLGELHQITHRSKSLWMRVAKLSRECISNISIPIQGGKRPIWSARGWNAD